MFLQSCGVSNASVAARQLCVDNVVTSQMFDPHLIVQAGAS